MELIKRNTQFIGSMIIKEQKYLKKNRSYGTLTSIYWIWKNDINDLGPNDYIGICHYRRFWLKEKHEKINFNNLNKNLLKTIPRKYLKYDSFVCRPQNVSGYKFMKLIKKAKKDLIMILQFFIIKKTYNKSSFQHVSYL